MSYISRVRLIRRSIKTGKLAAAVVLFEQILEVLFLGISLAEHPAIVIACVGALGFSEPSERVQSA